MGFRSLSVGIVWVITGCSIALPSGCSKRIKQPDLARVTGIVTYKGAPLPKAWVTFLPADSSGGLPAIGQTNDEGRFQLRTFRENDGCTLGRKAVVITALEGGSRGGELQVDPNSEIILEPGMPDFKQPKSLIPKRYDDTVTSGLTATVEAGKKNTFEFNLTDER